MWGKQSLKWFSHLLGRDNERLPKRLLCERPWEIWSESVGTTMTD